MDFVEEFGFDLFEGFVIGVGYVLYEVIDVM